MSEPSCFTRMGRSSSCRLKAGSEGNPIRKHEARRESQFLETWNTRDEQVRARGMVRVTQERWAVR